MYCNYCRALNPNDAVYCSKCGRTITAPVESDKDDAKTTKVGLNNSAPLSEDRPEVSPKNVEPSESGSSFGTSFPSVLARETKPQDEELSFWHYEKMTEDELRQLSDTYERLRTPVPQTLHDELQTLR